MMKRILTIWLGLALALMATSLLFLIPTKSVQAGVRQLNSGNAYTSSGTGGSPAFSPKLGHSKVSVFIIAEDVGAWTIQRCSRANALAAIPANCTWRAISSATVNVANVEDWALLDGPVTPIRVVYTNTDASAGTFSVEFIEGGESR